VATCRNAVSLCISTNKNKALQADWKNFGEEQFVFEVLERLKPAEEPGRNDREELEKMEQRWLEKLQPYGERGYNLIPKKGRCSKKEDVIVLLDKS